MTDKAARKALLKTWKEGERRKAREAFPLDDARLEAFFVQLQALFEKEGCFHDTRHAQDSIDALALSDDDANALLDWCEENGGYCDCEIAGNTFGHWQENRASS